MKVKTLLTSGLTSFCLLLTSCGGAMSKNATEFDWHATEAAPRHYPMEIIQGTFFYKDQDHGLYIPSGGTLHAGWGVKNSHHVTGPDKKPLPDRVDVVFYSYTEKQFYRGRFDLPYEKILSLFRQAYIDEPSKPYYRAIMIGIAPGGAVSVWLKGSRTTEVFFGQAEKIDVDPSNGFNLPFDSIAESDAYVEGIITDSLDASELESLKKNGVPFGTWSRYRNVYKWIPVYAQGKATTDERMPVSYLNGESYWEPTSFDEEKQNTPKPLPRELKFSVDMGDESVLYIIKFEEFELMDAFEKLGANGEKVYIEFDAQMPRENMKIRLYNDKAPQDVIELKKFYVKP